MVRTANYGYIEYGVEATYKGSFSLTRQFGMKAELSNHRINNNPIPLYKYNTGQVQKFARGNFDGSFSLTWVLSNPWFWDLVLGKAAVSAGTNPTTHTYTYDKAVKSFGLEKGFEGEVGNVVRTLKGCGINNFGLRANVGEVVTCSADCIYGEEPTTVGTTLDSSIADDDILFPYTFEHGFLEVPDGTVIAELQSVDLSIGNGLGLGRGFKNAFATSMYKGKFDLALGFTCAVKDKILLEMVLARQVVANAQLKFSNDLTLGNERSIDITMTTLEPAEHGDSMPLNEPVFQDLKLPFASIQVVASNATTLPP